jgi:hypothetical protein
VWRISEDAPMGKWVSSSELVRPARRGELPEVSHGNWTASSFDLLSGADVIENEDTIPGELFDELFAPPRKASGV